MKKFLSIIICLCITIPAFAYEKHYIKNNKGQATGYTRNYSNGVTKEYSKSEQLQYTYKKSSNGTITKYSKAGRKLESYK